ncbi:MAG: UDP-3-O-(3-hydroxymyristoyl)glucosamine N-acyltransferase [Candidatus Marinimicrobia bacterium]|nr:UDP-3-O-(3-hydroxymyristoyl)glucosamine N-acyltransferase [Candidatus Neomarinimicrobiota bacterium]
MIGLDKICEIIDGKIIGNSDISIKGLCDIEEGDSNCLSFIRHKSYEKFLLTTKASVIVVSLDFNVPSKLKKTFIKVKNPSLAFIKLLDYFKSDEIIKPSIHTSAIIDKTSKIGNNCFIGPNVIINNNTSIGDNVIIRGNSVIDSDCIIKSNTCINYNVTINRNVIIGNNCFIDSGTTVGSEGFGTYKHEGKHLSIPHMGKVIIEDDVLIGSNCSIDRGTINNTIIGYNSKLDNMVHIGHNVQLGKSCLICAQTGIGGSCNIGDNVTIGGKVGFIDHINIGENTSIVAHSMVFKSVEANSYISGDPARNHRDRIKQDICISKLPNHLKNKS